MPWPRCHVAMVRITWFCSIDIFGRRQVGYLDVDVGRNPLESWLFKKFLATKNEIFTKKKSQKMGFPPYFLKQNIRIGGLRAEVFWLFSEPEFEKNPWKAPFFLTTVSPWFRSQHLWKSGTCRDQWCCECSQPIPSHWINGVLCQLRPRKLQTFCIHLCSRSHFPVFGGLFWDWAARFSARPPGTPNVNGVHWFWGCPRLRCPGKTVRMLKTPSLMRYLSYQQSSGWWH